MPDRHLTAMHGLGIILAIICGLCVPFAAARGDYGAAVLLLTLPAVGGGLFHLGRFCERKDLSEAFARKAAELVASTSAANTPAPAVVAPPSPRQELDS